MHIEVLPVLRNSLMYLLVDESSNTAAVIDAADVNKLEKAARRLDAKIVAVLSTDNKWDHTRDNEEVKRLFPDAVIYGSRGDNTRAMDKEAKHGQHIKVGNLDVIVKDAHSFTEGSLIFEVQDPSSGEKAVFTGGTLLCGGAGAINVHAIEGKIADVPSKKSVPKGMSGTAKDLFRVLNDILGSLDDDVEVYPGYDSVVENLRFAVGVEPENEDIEMRLAEAKDNQKNKVPNVPSTLGLERKTNPFMRLREKTVRQYAQLEGSKHDNPIDVLDSLQAKMLELGLHPKMQTA